jgi:diaminopimelate epimerase
MNFIKMHGCGNDFILTHDVSEEEIAHLVERVPLLCDRHRGIGADGVILVLPSAGADFRMRIFNADASEAEMCGNGVRCFARYLKLSGISAKERLTIETLAGPIQTEMKGDQVRVDMGAPILDPAKIPVAVSGPGPVLMHELRIKNRVLKFTAVSMGNPHAVIFTDDLSDDLVLGHGRLIEPHPLFPRKVNVEFIQVLNEREIRMRVFERGCGETAACGTGACAAVVAGVLNRRHGNVVTVHLNGGDLLVEWDGNPAHPVFMNGPAVDVFRGIIEL